LALLLTAHSLWRWVLLVVALVAIFGAWRGWLVKRLSFSPFADRMGMFYGITVDVQVLLGAVLWIVEQRWLALAAAGTARFFSLEHPVVMVLALGLAHAGRSQSRKGDDAVRRYRSAAIFYSLSFLFILAAIPWSRLMGR
jgi:ribose/xylose/arabinose/galactoside ABC-type transport system permease subunit